MINRPRGRDLTPDELRAFVGELAGRPELWSGQVQHCPGRRVYEQLHRDQHIMAWLICWMNDQDTGFHDHDVSAGAVSVVQGAVTEERLLIGGRPVARTYAAGSVFDFSATDIHRVAHVGEEPAVTLHVYSPPLWRMGSYLVTRDGALRRQSISYAEELRPLLAA